MAEFNVNAHLRDVLGLNTTPSYPPAPSGDISIPTSKQEKVAEASERKVRTLQEHAQLAEEAQERNKNSWVTRLGVDPEGYFGKQINESAKDFNRVGTALGPLAESLYQRIAPLSYTSDVQYGRERGLIPEEDIKESAAKLREALSFKDAVHTPEHSLLEPNRSKVKDYGQFIEDTLTSVGGAVVGGVMNVPEGIRSTLRTVEEASKEVGRILGVPDWNPEWLPKSVANPSELLRPITEPLGDMGIKVVDQAQEAVTEDNKYHFARISELGEKAFDDAIEGDFDALADIITDPEALVHYGTSAALTLALAALTGGVGIFAMEGGSSVMDSRKFAKENGPVDDAAIAAAFLQTGVLNTVLEKFGLDRVMGKAAEGKLLKAISKKLGDKGIGGFIQKGTKILSAGGIEGFTEGLQNTNQNLATKLYVDETQKLSEGLVASVIGGKLAGTSVAGLREIASSRSDTPRDDSRMDTDTAKVFESAVAANDPSAFLQENSPNYDPVRAVSVLHEAATSEEATPELREANVKQAAQLIEQQDKEIKQVQAELERRSPEAIERYKTEVDHFKQLLEELSSDAPADERAQIENNIAVRESLIEQGVVTQRDTQEAQKKIKQIEDRIEQMTKTRDLMLHQEMKAYTPEMVDADVEAVSTLPEASADPEVGERTAQAANRLIRAAMAAPERLTAEQLFKLQRSPVLSEDQKGVLRKLDTTRQAANSLKDGNAVHKDILQGAPKTKTSPRFLGINDHVQRIGAALASGATTTAENFLADLSAFRADQAQKLERVREALKMARRLDKTVSVRRYDDGWRVNEEKFETPEARRENGGLNIHRGSGQMESLLVQGVKALSEAEGLMQAALNLHKNSPVATPTSQPTGSSSSASTGQPEVASSSQSTGSTQGVQGASPTTGNSSEVQSPTVNSTPPTPSTGTDSSTGAQAPANLPRVQVGEAGQPEPGSDATTDTPAWEGPDSFVRDAQGNPVSVREQETSPEANEVDPLIEEHPPWDDFWNDHEINEDGRVVPKSKATAGATPPAGESAAETPSTNPVGQGIPTSGLGTGEGVSSASEQQGSEEVAGQERDVSVVEDGRLAIMNQEVDSSLPLTDPARNLIAEQLKQTSGKPGSDSARPLVLVKNFLTHLRNRTINPLDYVSNKFSSLSDKQEQLLRDFTRRTQDWSTVLDQLITERKGKKAEYKFTDLMQYLITQDQDGKPVLEENVKAAILFSLYNYVAEARTDAPLNTPAQINRMLQRDEDHPVSDEDFLRYGRGMPQHMMIDQLGQQAYEALGFTEQDNTFEEVPHKLRAGLGAYTLRLGQELGLIEEFSTDLKALMESYQGDLRDVEKSAFSKLFSLKVDPETFKPLAGSEAEQIWKLSAETQQVLSHLFGAQALTPLPTLSPQKALPKTASRSRQGLPKVVQSMLKKQNATPVIIDHNIMESLLDMDEESLGVVLGVQEVSEDTHHIDDRDSVNASNEALWREWDNLVEWRDYLAGLDGETPYQDIPFYLEHAYYRNGRSGIKSLLNPQNSKNVHRYLLTHPSWKSKVHASNATQMQNFRLRLAEAFGIGTDKRVPEASLPALDKLLADPTMLRAVEAVQRKMFVEGYTYTQADQTYIAEAARRGSVGTHVFLGLTAWAQQRQAQVEAKNNGETDYSFDTYLVAERDGVANGPSLMNILLGAFGSREKFFAFMRMGGFYRESDGVTQFNQYKAQSPQNRDFYEHASNVVVDGVLDKLTKDKKSKTFNIFNLLWQVGGHFIEDGVLRAGGITSGSARDKFKALLNPVIYGSGSRKAIENMADAFLENFRKLVVDAHQKGSPASRKTLDQAIKAFNLIMGKDAPQLHISPSLSTQELMNLRITRDQRSAFLMAFNSTLGRVVRKTLLEGELGTFIARRDALTQTSQTAYKIYEGVYNAVREQYINELVASGDIKTNSKGVPQHGLTKAQTKELEARVRKAYPMMHTVLSKMDGDVEAGIHLADVEHSLSMESTFSSEVSVGTTSNRAKQMQARPYVPTLADPRVKAASASVHSFDGGNMFLHINGAEHAIGNNHDSSRGPLASALRDSQDINEVTFLNLLRYSPLQEAYESLERTVQGALEMLNEAGEYREIVERGIAQGIIEQTAQVYLSDPDIDTSSPPDLEGLLFIFREIAAGVAANATLANETKFAGLEEITHIGQYAMDGGSAKVTPAMREALKQAKENSQVVYDEALFEQLLTELDSALEAAHAETVLEWDAIYDRRFGKGSPRIEEGESTLVSRRQKKRAKPKGVSKNHYGAFAFTEYTPVEQAQIIQATMQLYEETDSMWEKLNTVLQSYVESNKHLVQVVSEAFPSHKEGLEVMEALQASSTGLNQEAATWGDLVAAGTEYGSQHDTELARFLESSKNLTASGLVDFLIQRLGKPDPNLSPDLRAMYRKLAQMAKRVVATRDFPVHYVTPSLDDSITAGHLDSTFSNEFARFSVNGDEVGLFIKSRDYEQSLITSELVLHEIIHGALAELIYDVKNGLNKDPDTVALVEDIEGLFEAARAYAKEKNLTASFAQPLLNLDEFIAYGLTNLEFQSQVLVNVSYESKSQENKHLRRNGMQAFLEGVKQLFAKALGLKDVKALNGLNVLVANVSGLMAAQTESPTTTNTRQIRRAMAATDNTPDPYRYTTQEVREALAQNGAVSPGFEAHLDGVLKRIVDAMHGPYGAFKAEVEGKVPHDPMDVYNHAKATGQSAFTLSLDTAGVKVTDQEGFVIEQTYITLREALGDPEGPAKTAYRQLERLYNEGRKALQGQIDPQTYDFVFKLEKDGEGKLDYLARFGAMALGSEAVHQALQFETTLRDAREAKKSLAFRIQEMYYDFMEWLTSRTLQVFTGQRADAKLEALATHLVASEIRRKNTIKKSGVMDSLDNSLRKVAKTTVGGTAKTIERLLPNTNNTWVKTAKLTTKIIADERVGDVVTEIQSLRDRFDKSSNGLVMATTQYIKGFPQKVLALLQQGKHIQAERQRLSDAVSRSMLGSFKDEGAYLVEEDKPALGNTFLRTGAFILLERFNMSGLDDLLTSPARVKREIQAAEARVKALQPRFHRYLSSNVHALGAHLALGGSALEAGLLMNTDNIARMLTDVKNKNTLSERAMQELIPELDLLVSLHALHYTSAQDKQRASKVLGVEMARQDGGNGVEAIIKMHKALLTQSREQLFKEAEVNLTQYHLPEIYNPRVLVELASEDQLQDLKDRGYEVIGPVQQDNLDPEVETKYMVRLRDGGMPSRVSATVGYIDNHLKGTETGQTFAPAMKSRARRILQAKQKHVQRLQSSATAFDARTVPNKYMVPVFDTKGDITGWRYLMTAKTQNEVLERDNRFDHLLGSFAGKTLEKATTPTHNRDVVQTLYDVYRAEYKDRPHSFRMVSATSSDPHLKQQYALLPESMKESIVEIWGAEGMAVPNELMDVIFGFREPSVVLDAFDKPESERNWAEQAFVSAAQIVFEMYGRAKGMSPEEAQRYAKRARIVLRRGELMVQDGVKILKDTIVIKTITVLAGNITSNTTVLGLEGVPIKDIIGSQFIAFRGVIAYVNDSRELHHLQGMLASNYLAGQPRAEIERKIQILEDKIAKNPVKEMVDDGLLPTIVDDISMEDNRFAYPSLLKERLQPYTDKLPSSMKWVGKQVFMTHDTQLYKLLNQMTQYSDFVARYALRKHLMERADNPMTREEANFRATEAFVNYDVPLPKGLHYLDSMGLLLFYKYFLSIQRAIARSVRERPARALALLAAKQWIDGVPTILDSAAGNYLGRLPGESSVLGLPGAMMETGVIKGMSAPF